MFEDSNLTRCSAILTDKYLLMSSRSIVPSSSGSRRATSVNTYHSSDSNIPEAFNLQEHHGDTSNLTTFILAAIYLACGLMSYDTM